MRLADVGNWVRRSWAAVPKAALADSALAAFSAQHLPDPAHETALLGAGQAAAAEVAPVPAWSAIRVGVAEDLWGEGFVTPGGAEDVLRLAAPLGLSQTSSVLLLGAGLGGAAQVLAEEFDAWVNGYEADPTLAALAATRLKRLGGEVARRASVSEWGPATPPFKPRGFHHAIALDVIQGGPSKALLQDVARALKAGGQIVLVQLVSDRKLDPDDPALVAWARLERRAPVVPTEAEITRILARLKFDVRVVEDISARHANLALQGWATLVRALEGPKPPPMQAACIVGEAERWMRRLRLMQAGQLRLVRWHGIGREMFAPKP
jgi:SAM-dependent methyltransferase